MSYTARRRAPVINTTIASYQPSHRATSSTHSSTYSNARSTASSSGSRSRSPAPVTPTSAADENYPSSEYDDRAQDDLNSEDFVLAMHDFVPVAPNVQCLSFRAGQVIHVLNRDQTGWWDGELDGRRGWFPSNYVNAQTSTKVSPPRTKKVHFNFRCRWKFNV